MPDPMVREIGRVTDIDGDVTIIGVDYETVTVEPMAGQARLDELHDAIKSHLHRGLHGMVRSQLRAAYDHESAHHRL